MKKQTLQQWEKYNEWIEEENKSINDYWTRVNKKMMTNYKRAKTRYEKLVKANLQKVDKRKKEIEQWEKLSFWKKLKNKRPEELNRYDAYMFHRQPSFPFFIPPVGLKKATWEGFLDWQLTQSKSKGEIR